MFFQKFRRLRSPVAFSLLLILFFLLSCSREESKDQQFKADTLYFSAKDLLFKPVLFVPDVQAVGLSESWYSPANFPFEKISSEAPAAAPYIWFAAFLQLPEDSQTIEIAAEPFPEGTLLWLNGELKELSPSDHSASKLLLAQLPGGLHFMALRLPTVDLNEVILPALHFRSLDPVRTQTAPVSPSLPELLSVPKSHNGPFNLAYKVFLRNFTPNGTFSGMRNKLDYVRRLGADMIILMPVHPNGPTPEGRYMPNPYAVQRHFITHYDMGRSEQFSALLQSADSMGFDLSLEAVLDRSSVDHYYTRTNRDIYLTDERGQIQRASSPGSSDRDFLLFDVTSSSYQSLISEYFAFWSRNTVLKRFTLMNSRRSTDSDDIRILLKNLTDQGFDFFADEDMMSDDAVKDLIFSHYYSQSFYDTLMSVQSESSPTEAIFALLAEELSSDAVPLHYLENSGTDKARRVFASSFYTASFLKMLLPGLPVLYSGEELGRADKMDLYNRNYPDWRAVDGRLTDLVEKAGRLRRRIYAADMTLLRPLNIHPRVFAAAVEYEGKNGFILANFASDSLSFPLPAERLILSDGKSSLNNENLQLSPYGYIYAE